jgi:hypothetical protein
MLRTPALFAMLTLLTSAVPALAAETPIEAATRMGKQCSAWGNNGCAVLCQGALQNMQKLPASMHPALLQSCSGPYEAASRTSGGTQAQAPAPHASPAAQAMQGNTKSAEMLRLAKACKESGPSAALCARRCEQYAALPPNTAYPAQHTEDLEACRKMHAQAGARSP